MRRADAPLLGVLGWMESLADRTRLRLLRLLSRHELGVAELCAVLQLPQSTVSRHLRVLADRGWVAGRKRRTAVLYRMTGEDLDAAARKLWQVAAGEIEGWPAVAQDDLRLERVLRERAGTEAGFFDSRAGGWDALRREMYGDSFLLDAAVALLPRGSVVADLGCGTGFLASRLSAAARKVIAVDGSRAMLAAARKRTAGRTNVELIRAELSALPVADGVADAALLVLVLTYVEDPPAVLREAARILAPGGRIVVADLLRHDREDFRRRMEHVRAGFDSADIEGLLSHAGFSDVRCTPLAPESAAKGPALFVARGVKE